MNRTEPTPIHGIRYYQPPKDAILTGLDGRVSIPYADIPIPLLEEDYRALDGVCPSYDVVGRGIYQALRTNPDCILAGRYAQLLKEAYPHYLSELASHILMLEHKDVEVSYLDRKINYLKIFALIEPENPQFPLEIGVTLLDRGMRLSALHLSTVTLYRAEDFLRRALLLSPDHVTVRNKLGEVCYILGKYQDAAQFWHGILPALDAEEAQKLEVRLESIAEKRLPQIPAVDYLEAVGAAFSLFDQGKFEEAAAIFQDIIGDTFFCEQFSIPEIYYFLGLCCVNMNMPRYAEEYLQEALQLNPDYQDARNALAQLYR